MGGELTCAEAEAVAWRAAVACAALEGVVAGAPVALGLALVGLLESGALAWSVGAVCGALVFWIVFKGRMPSRLESLARADAGLGLRGALEVGVTLEEEGRESRFGEAIAAALAGRLGSAQVARAGVALKPTLLSMGLLVSFVLASAIRVESRGDVHLREARLMAGRPTLDAAGERRAEAEKAAAKSEAQASPKEEERGAPRTSDSPERAAAESGEAESAALPGPGEAAAGDGATEAPGGSSLQNSPPSASESSKLAVEAPSGVTPGPEGGKIAASSASRTSGAWWPARHDAVVRAWLDSLHSSVRR